MPSPRSERSGITVDDDGNESINSEQQPVTMTATEFLLAEAERMKRANSCKYPERIGSNSNLSASQYSIPNMERMDVFTQKYQIFLKNKHEKQKKTESMRRRKEQIEKIQANCTVKTKRPNMFIKYGGLKKNPSHK